MSLSPNRSTPGTTSLLFLPPFETFSSMDIMDCGNQNNAVCPSSSQIPSHLNAVVPTSNLPLVIPSRDGDYYRTLPSERGEHWKVHKWIRGTVESRATIKAAIESELPPSLWPGAKPHIVHSWSLDLDHQIGQVPPAMPPHAHQRPQIEEARYVGNGAALSGSLSRDMMQRRKCFGIAQHFVPH